MWDRRMLAMYTVTTCIFHFARSGAAVLSRPAECNKLDTFFKYRHEYTYDYTAETSSSFVGATESSTGSQISCTVTLGVPRKCEIVMKLSGCSLKERSNNEYTMVEGAADFLQNLERHSIYFQMNKGLVIADTIVIDDGDTIEVANFKRGLLSALQFQILEADKYNSPVIQKDVFGTCETQYTFSTDVVNTIKTYRNLRECEIRQIFKKQMTNPFSTIRQMTGGLIEEPISEGIYPFVSEVSCTYTLLSGKRLKSVTCLQQQYCKPLSYKGDILATAMANISQTITFQSAKRKKLTHPDLKLDGRSITDIIFDFGVDHNGPATEVSQLDSTMSELTSKLVEAKFDEVPGVYGKFVNLLRLASTSVLDDYVSEVFDGCLGDACEDVHKSASQTFFLDGLESCGTEPCLLHFLHCLHEGHVKTQQRAEFLQSLGEIELSENVQKRVLEYCQKSGYWKCWLSLGTVISKNHVATDQPTQVEPVLVAVVEHIMKIYDDNCGSGTITASEQELNTAVKTFENIGIPIVQDYIDVHPKKEKPYIKKMRCLNDPNIPKSMKRNILKLMDNILGEINYTLSPLAVETLFSILDNVNMDTPLRLMAFSTLMKTTDHEIIKRLVKKIGAKDTTQMKSYITSAIRTLLQNDQPDLKDVRAAWEAVRKEKYFHSRYNYGKPNAFTMSKTINIAKFFKLAMTEYFGGQLYMDIVFDPSSRVFSALSVSVNYFYDNQKYNVFDISMNIHGFDLLIDVITKQTNLTPGQLYAMYTAYSAKAGSNSKDNSEQQAKFQQNIANAIMEMLENVNHPKFTDFDFAVDFQIRGKNVLFVSLQEIMMYIREVRASIPADKPPLVQSMLKRFLASVPVSAFKSLEWVNLIKILPTCAGLPLNMTVQMSGLNKIDHVLQSNALLFMAKQSPTLNANVHQFATLNNELYGELVIPVGQYHSSGIKMIIDMGSERDVKVGLTIAPPGPSNDKHSKSKIQLDLSPISENKDSETLFYARGRMLLLRDSTVDEVQGNTDVETVYTRCANSHFQTVLGRSFCTRFVWPKVHTSRTHAYFPLSGPFEMTVKMEKLDSVLVYNLIFEHETEKLDDGTIYTLRFTHLGKGVSMDRLYTSNIVYNSKENSMTYHNEAPELEFDMKGVYLQRRNGQHRDLEISEVMSIANKPIFGYILKASSEGSYYDNPHKSQFSVKLTAPGVSWKFELVGEKSGNQRDIQVKTLYYCSQDRPFLYLLHINPVSAEKNGDTTEVHFHAMKKDSGEIGDAMKGNSGKKGDAMKNDPGTDDDYDRSFMIRVYDTSLKAETRVKQDPLSTFGDTKMTYTSEGVARSLSVSESVIRKQSSNNPLNHDVNLKIDGDDFNMVMKGSVEGSYQNLIISTELQYTNNEENDANSRKKRSLKSIYQKLRAIEEEIPKKLVEIKDAILGKSEPDITTEVELSADGSSDLAAMLSKLPPLIPEYPSIWEYKEWTAKMDFTAMAMPVFIPGEEGKGPPVGLEFHTTMNVNHPWNGGYRKLEHKGIWGKNMKNSFKFFKVWIEGSDNSTFTTLDGSPVLKDGELYVIRRSGSLLTERVTGRLFKLDMHHHGPLADIDYSILFDWEASSHHEPLYRVISKHKNAMFPLFDHSFEESLSWEKDSNTQHSANFEHELLKVRLNTEISRDYFKQNGSLTLQFGAEKTWSYRNSYSWKDPLFTTEISTDTVPDKIFVFKFSPGEKPDKQIVVEGLLKKAPSTDAEPLWKAVVEIAGSHIRQLTYTWSPAVDVEMETQIRTSFFAVSGYLDIQAEQIRENMNKPLMHQTFMFTSMTPSSMMQQYVFPKVIHIWTAGLNNVITNLFIPLKTRQAILDSPGPKVPPKLAIFLRGVKKNMENAEPNEFVKLIQALNYLTLKGCSQLVSQSHYKLFSEVKLREIMEKHTAVLAWSDEYVATDIRRFPKRSEAMEQIFGSVYSTWYDKINLFKHNLKPTSEKLAAVFGRHDPVRDLNIRSFDGSSFKVPADKAMECTYLLAADVKQKQFSVVLSPSGITLLTQSTAVTIGYDSRVYMNDCKHPSMENLINSTDGTVTVEQLDDRIEAKTKFGVYVICYTLDSDVCLVGLKGSNWYHNGTIGLLGTNDNEKITDRRLVQGQNFDSEDTETFLSEYVVAGPKSCKHRSVTAEIPTFQTKPMSSEPCSRELTSQCYKTLHSSNLYMCDRVISRQSFGGYSCSHKQNGCHYDEKDLCAKYRAYTGACEKAGLVREAVTLPDFCDTIIFPPMESHEAGSLDIVFVISQHSVMRTMMTPGREAPWEYMFQLMTFQHETWAKFKEIRMGAVAFGGFGNDHVDHIMWQRENGNRYFTERGDFEWESVHDVTADGKMLTDGFSAIDTAANYPFKPTAHKMIVVITTKEQGTSKMSEPDKLKTKLKDQGIVLNVISTYAKTASKRVIGLNWDGRVITKKSGYDKVKLLPNDHYCMLVRETKGAVWALQALSRAVEVKVSRIIEEFGVQMHRTNGDSMCPAA